MTFWIDDQAVGEIKLAFPIAKGTSLSDEIPLTVEFLNALIAGIRDKYIAHPINSNSPGGTELSRLLG